MEVVILDGKEYYSEADLKKADPAFFFGCSRNRSMIVKKKIPSDEYVFVTKNKKTNQWKVSSEDYKPAKLLVSRRWVEDNVPVFTVRRF